MQFTSTVETSNIKVCLFKIDFFQNGADTFFSLSDLYTFKHLKLVGFSTRNLKPLLLSVV